jgi:hypothetical protein
MTKKPDLQSLKDFIKNNPQLKLKLPTIRGWIRCPQDSGAHTWVRRVGRLIFVDVEKFFEWTRRK